MDEQCGLLTAMAPAETNLILRAARERMEELESRAPVAPNICHFWPDN
jgi:hypothetical protein